MIRVSKLYGGDGSKKTGEYIGRGSELGNPFKLSEYTLKDSLSAYRRYLWESYNDPETSIHDEILRLKAIASTGEDITLLCFCVESDDPHDRIVCHGQIIRNLILYLIKG